MESIKMVAIVVFEYTIGFGTSVEKGEMVIVISGFQPEPTVELSEEIRNTVHVLLKHHSVKDACAIAAEITGEKKNKLYQYAIKL